MTLHMHCVKQYNNIMFFLDRPNIFIDVVTGPGLSFEEQLQWIVDCIQKSDRQSPKILLYCRTVDSCDAVYEFLLSSLDAAAYADTTKPRSATNRLLAKFHALIGEPTKKYVQAEFTKADSHIRILVCTIAFGMGVDIPDVRQVVHWGLPKDELSYWQELGRAGRDGLPSKATIYVVRALFSSAISTHFLDDIRQACGIPLPLARDTGRSKATQTETLESETRDAAKCQDSFNRCIRRLILREVYVQGMKSCEWLFEEPKCTSAVGCPLKTCCTYCKGLCECSN